MPPALTQPLPPKQHRFFIALLPPPEIQRYATTVKTYFRDTYGSQAALRSPPHITLQPPFEWPAAEYERLSSTLAAFRPTTSTIAIRLSGFGAFPPRVIYLAVEHAPALIALQAELSQFVEDRLGVREPRTRDRPFCPHLTVAFRDLKPAAFRQAWPEFASQTAQFAFTVSDLTLLRHTGHRWEIDQQLPLQ